jgi:flagellar protein FliS
MNMSHKWKKFMEHEIKTSSPIKITIMAYEKCILNVRLAAQKIKEKNYEESDRLLERVEMIMNEFLLSLNHDLDPELTGNLQRLYEYVLIKVRVMKGAKDLSLEASIVEVLGNLLDGYRGVYNDAK